MTLSNGHKTSYRLEKGQRFGRWEVLNSEPIWEVPSGKKYYSPFYECACLCGTKKLILGYTLLKGKSRSCGCVWKEQTLSNNPFFKGFEGLSHSYFGRIKRGAAQRRFSFDLTIEDAWQLLVDQEFKCALSGAPIAFDKLVGRGGSASLDRIDSKAGYVLGNVQWVHKDVNLMKNHFSQEKFIDTCKKIAAKHGGACLI